MHNSFRDSDQKQLLPVTLRDSLFANDEEEGEQCKFKNIDPYAIVTDWPFINEYLQVHIADILPAASS